MQDLVNVRLRTLVWLILPVLILVIVPWCLRRLAHEAVSGHWGLSQWLGVWLLANGVGLGAWCVNLFNVEGQGTPLPLDPPRRFIVSGPYRYVRNPMFLGAFLILGGQMAICESSVLAVYTLALMVGAHLFVRYWEEPDLARRFGEPYRQYQQQVPRWIPRLPRGRKTA